MPSISGIPQCIDCFVLLCLGMLSVSAGTLNVHGSNYAVRDIRNNSSTTPSCEFNITSMVGYDYYDDEARLVVIIDLLPSFCKHQLEIELYSGTCHSNKVLHTPRRLGSKSSNQNGAEHPCSPDSAIPLMANKLLALSEVQANFTLEHVYSGNYCLLVYIDQEAAMRKTYHEPFTIENEKLTSLAFLTDWNTTINVFSPSHGKVIVKFTLPDPKYDVSQFIVTLQKINGDCENRVWANPTDLGMICLKPNKEKNQTFIEVEFVNRTDGNYCVLITPFDVRCHPNATYWKSDPFSNCTRFYPGTFTIQTSNSSTTIPSCEFNVTTMVKYKYFGEEARLNIFIDLLPPFCQRDQMAIQLYSGTCHSNKVLHTPTRLGFKSTYQNGGDRLCSPSNAIPLMANELLALSEVQANFTLEHVYSGTYCLFVYLHQEASYESYNTFLAVNSSKEIVFPIAWNPILDVYSPSHGKLIVRFTVPDPKYNLLQFIVTLQKINGNCNNAGVWAKPTVLETMCIKPVSNYEQSQTLIEEHFENLTEGNYCVSITPFDVRCHPEATYWQSDQFSSCTRLYPHTIIIDSGPLTKPVGSEPVCCSRVDWSIIGIGTFFALSAFATALALLWLFRKRLKTMICNIVIPDVTMPVPMHKVSPKAQPSTVAVLLLYATDDPMLCKKVQKLKHILTTIGFCNVFDFRDESTFDTLATYGPDWISKLIASPDMKIIVVISTGAREAQKLTQGIEMNSSNSEELVDPLDYVYLQGLKQVMVSGIETNVVYRRCFSVRFPEITGPEVTLSSITPFVFFLLPENTEQLLWHIHGCLPEKRFWNTDCNLW